MIIIVNLTTYCSFIFGLYDDHWLKLDDDVYEEEIWSGLLYLRVDGESETFHQFISKNCSNYTLVIGDCENL